MIAKVLFEGREALLIAVTDYPPQACLADPVSGHTFLAPYTALKIDVKSQVVEAPPSVPCEPRDPAPAASVVRRRSKK